MNNILDLSIKVIYNNKKVSQPIDIKLGVHMKFVVSFI